MERTARIVAESVFYKYKRGRPATIADLSITLDDRSTLLVGPNGAGKSTFLRLLAGILRPSSGTCQTLAKIGYCSQNPAILRGFTVRQQVEYAAWLSGSSRTEARSACPWSVELVGITPLVNRLVHTLSGGEAAKLGICCGLVGRPAVLILDEPTASLDPLSRSAVSSVIDAISQTGVTVVATSHNASDIGSPYRRLLLLDHGRLVYDGTWQTFLSETLDNPAAFEFADALRKQYRAPKYEST